MNKVKGRARRSKRPPSMGDRFMAYVSDLLLLVYDFLDGGLHG